MKKLSLIVAFMMLMLGAAQAQDKFDYKLVKEIADATVAGDSATE